MTTKIDWQENYDLGKTEFLENNFTTAQIYLLQVVKSDRGFADVFNMLGVIYCHQNNYDDAVISFKKALEINPNYTESCLNLAVCYNDMGDFSNSQAMYAQAKESSSDSSTSYIDPTVGGKIANMHANLGDIYRDLSMFKEALTEYDKALKLRDEFVDIQLKKALVYRDLKDFDKTLSELKSAKEKKPDFVAASLQLGITHFMMDEKDKAKADWQHVLSIDSSHQLANMYLKMIK